MSYSNKQYNLDVISRKSVVHSHPHMSFTLFSKMCPSSRRKGSDFLFSLGHLSCSGWKKGNPSQMWRCEAWCQTEFSTTPIFNTAFCMEHQWKLFCKMLKTSRDLNISLCLSSPTENSASDRPELTFNGCVIKTGSRLLTLRPGVKFKSPFLFSIQARWIGKH